MKANLKDVWADWQINAAAAGVDLMAGAVVAGRVVTAGDVAAVAAIRRGAEPFSLRGEGRVDEPLYV